MSSDSTHAPPLPTLPDLLRPGLDLVFVGINPGERSAELGHYYGHPGNAFWRMLSASSLVDGRLGPEDDHRLLEHGIGFTDVVKRVITDSSQVSNAELRAAVPSFRERVAFASPAAVCFASTRAFSAVYPGAWRSLGWGWQNVEPLEGAEVWVMPSPSGRASGYHSRIPVVLDELATLRRADAKPGEGSVA